jgi:hypothetical protein
MTALADHFDEQARRVGLAESASSTEEPVTSQAVTK